MPATEKLTLIESVFVARLVACGLYGEPKPGLATELAAAAPDGITPANLLSAAEKVILNRNNGTFPTLPVCLAEIERHVGYGSSASERMEAYAASGITKANYCEMAIAYAKRNGGLVVIDRKADPDEWASWRSYYAQIAMRASASHMIGSAKWTVPSRHPGAFDSAYSGMWSPPDAGKDRPGDATSRKTFVATAMAKPFLRDFTVSTIDHEQAKARAIKEAMEAQRADIILRAADGDPAAIAEWRAQNEADGIAAKGVAA